jgi:hypothetical protein
MEQWNQNHTEVPSPLAYRPRHRRQMQSHCTEEVVIRWLRGSRNHGLEEKVQRLIQLGMSLYVQRSGIPMDKRRISNFNEFMVFFGRDTW